MALRILFHAPCFDGLASAALAADLLEPKHGAVQFEPVGYARRGSWLSHPPASPFAVVDFLYHPGAMFWADHHATTFLTPADSASAMARARAGEALHYDPRSPSCGTLLLGLFSAMESNDRRVRLASASRRTDAAEYASPEEALFGDSPEFRVSRALGAGLHPDQLIALVRDLRTRDLSEVAQRSDVVGWLKTVDERSRREVEHVARDAVLRDGVVVYSTESVDGILPARYAPYAIHRDANYSVALMRWAGGAKVTAMRNPWKDFDGVHIGPLLARWGGGGHARVGSLLLGPQEAADAERVVDELVAELALTPAVR